MWDQKNNAQGTAAWLLQPHSIDAFASAHYERAPLYIPRNDARYYSEYFDIDELQRVLYDGEVPAESISVAKEGIAARPESYIRKSGRINESKKVNRVEVIDPDRVSALFAHGCSIVLDRVQTYSPGVNRLCRGLESFFRHRVSANLYLTPADSQGFAVHYDTHDTLLLQIEGSKHWRVYGSGFALPLDEDEQKFNKKKTAIGDVQFEVEIKAGDFLYLPRGTMHAGTANDGLSMHLTLGLYPVKWISVLSEALAAAGASELLLRSSIGTLEKPHYGSRELAEMLERAFSDTALEAAARRIERKFVVGRHNDLDGQLQQLLLLPTLNDDSLLEIRGDMLSEVTEDEHGTALSFSGKVLKLPRSAAAMIRELETVSSASLAALKKHDENAPRIVERLIKEGFLIQNAAPVAARTSAVA
ncbi:MAG TPA: cupin domain-containing protein [Candidatus Baltobacteraceae bacterium]|jgi:hypothetical protein